ncbi:MAG: TIGR02266 family protein [Polyangiaceae bacterium]
MTVHADTTADRQSQPDPRRSHDRASLSLEVTLEGENNFFTGFTENISEGGLFVATHMARKVGERVVIDLTLPGVPAPVRAECEVRWLRMYSETSDAPPGMGLRFISLSDEGKASITEFVTRRAPLFWED